jgi:acyl-CoA synthetase (AMP-forming)/AMP-acid ligase II
VPTTESDPTRSVHAMSEPDEDAEVIPAVMARRRTEDGDLRALVDDDGAVTFTELDDASQALAARLVAAGVGKGDRVGLLEPNGIGWATTALAVMRVGAVLVPLSTLLRPPELLAQLQAAAVTHLIAARRFRDRSYLDDLQAAAPGVAATTATGGRHAAVPFLRAVWADDDLPAKAVPPAFVDALEERVRPADDMVILFTSGSRGAPKGTIHTHGSALRAVAAGLEARCVRRGERLYIPMPFFWTGGFAGGLLTALVAGATLLTEAIPDPTRTLAMLERERVTLFRGWPDQAAQLAAHPAFADADLSSLRDGSLPAVLPPDRRPAPGARANLFGMTESCGPWCGDRLDTDMPAGKHGSCGRPFPSGDIRIADPDSGELVPAGETGEICLRGPTLLRGICGRERSTVFTPDGYYPTGDLGQLDADGYLWYVGRRDDMVKVRGATVYPSEVEAALRTIPGITHAFVTDIPMPTPGSGVEVGAVVVVEGGCVAAADIAGATRERLSAFKVPTVWLVAADLGAVPRSATGKVDKAGLQRLLAAEGIAAQPTRGERHST